mmetsp:Transcript_22714/g.38901  ORF Transcript_22714/g.38901 Transcript_22714/m.38901 type:complete len:161 (+) Transcript_22714:91-573(+)|eukprot:CAMPEP_0183702086 /NCGR_PEP_ID=MMETSP0737-20130205/299_1 /TAXON_ID=385413 /ORGANISM="Thalassiosira miniscula, Strain CCMP1093" /LENGTH=160 /DNA_ID=CAMNT_0025928629 /DNA_START=91 /DNA_END=573 /DNA_ORIENTATION=+
MEYLWWIVPLLSLLLVATSAVYTSSVHRLLQENENIRVFDDQASAIAAASREEVCTIILFGAPWDGHFKAFVGHGYSSGRSLRIYFKMTAALILRFLSTLEGQMGQDPSRQSSIPRPRWPRSSGMAIGVDRESGIKSKMVTANLYNSVENATEGMKNGIM